MRPFLFLAFLAALPLALTGCTYEPSLSDAPRELVFTSVDGDVYRQVDRQAGVVCYSNEQALSCLPLNQTRLPQEPDPVHKSPTPSAKP